MRLRKPPSRYPWVLPWPYGLPSLSHRMPTERLPALGHDGNAYVVVRKTPSFQAISRRDSQYDMARYRLDSGEALAPTGEPYTFRTDNGKIVLTLIRA